MSGSLLYYVLSKAGIENVWGLLKGINPFAFAVAIVMYVLSNFVSTLRWRLLLPAGFRVGRLFSLYLIGAFFSTFLPGIIGGDAVKAYYLYKDTGHAGQSMASVFMDRYIGFVSLMAIGALAFPFGLPYFKGSWAAWTLPLIVASFCAVSLLIFRGKIGSGFQAAREVYGYLAEYKGKGNVMLKAFLFSLLIQFIVMGSVYVLSLGMGLRLSPLMFLMFYPIIVTVSMLPVSISGIGPREAAFVLLLGFAGVSPQIATALSFAWFVSMTAGSLPGLVLYLRHRTGDGKLDYETRM